MSGLDRIQNGITPLPSGSKVGLLCHHASVTSNGIHAVDLLASRSEVEVCSIFSPEHGFHGNAAPGEHVEHDTHGSTGVPIYSLYGKTRTPRPDWLANLDLMVIDLKDLGVRCYTYASTLYDMLHACAAQHVPVMVLDRPTPLEGIVDGPHLEGGSESFVGKIPLPLVYGKSQGPLALYLKETLPALRDLDLMVVSATQDHSPWIPPSPAIVSEASALCYPITVWSEAIPNMWVDRGGEASFQVWAMPEFPAVELSQQDFPGVRFQPDEVQTPSGIWPGLRFEVTDRSVFRPVSVAHHILSHLCGQWGPDVLFNSPEARPDFFDQLAGGPSWRSDLIGGKPPDFLQH